MWLLREASQVQVGQAQRNLIQKAPVIQISSCAKHVANLCSQGSLCNLGLLGCANEHCQNRNPKTTHFCVILSGETQAKGPGLATCEVPALMAAGSPQTLSPTSLPCPWSCKDGSKFFTPQNLLASGPSQLVANIVATFVCHIWQDTLSWRFPSPNVKR